jgi:hypothetical protein
MAKLPLEQRQNYPFSLPKPDTKPRPHADVTSDLQTPSLAHDFSAADNPNRFWASPAIAPAGPDAAGSGHQRHLS